GPVVAACLAPDAERRYHARAVDHPRTPHPPGDKSPRPYVREGRRAPGIRGKRHRDVPRPRVRTWTCARAVTRIPGARRPRPKPALSPLHLPSLLLPPRLPRARGDPRYRDGRPGRHVPPSAAVRATRTDRHP